MISHSFATRFSTVLSVVVLSTGCSPSAAPPSGSGTATVVSGSLRELYLLTAEPDRARDVIAVRESAEHGEEVVILGRIGGSTSPWVEGVAAFSIVDPSLTPCSDMPGDGCPTPWDYCCEADLSKSKVLVKVIDDRGNVVRADARDLLQVQELITVVVKGKAHRDDAGNLTVLATGIFVRR